MQKIRWGVLGTSWISQAQTIPGMLQSGNCELYAIAGRNAEKVAKFVRNFGFRKGYIGYDAMLADPNVQAIYVALPNDLHSEWVERCLNSGKHVLCEKPLTQSCAESERLFSLAMQKNLLLMEAFAYLHSPLIAAIRAELDSGIVGDICFMESAFISTYAPPDNFRTQRKHFGGSIYDLGCYPISAILWMLRQNPTNICACANFSPTGVDTYCSGLLSFDKSAQAAFACGFTLPCDTNGKFLRIDRFRIVGTKGVLDTPARFNQCGNLFYTRTSGGISICKSVYVPQNYQLEVEQFSRSIVGLESPLVSPSFSLSVASILDKVLEKVGY